MDKIFLNSRYGNNDGEQFKAVDAFGTINDIFSDFKWMGNDSSAYLNHYELKSDLTPATWRRLISLIDTLNHTGQITSSLPLKVNLAAYYKAMASDILLGNLDSYVYSGRNFYVYFPSNTNLMSWIIWDTGLSFGALPGGPSNIESLPVTYVESDTGRPLFSKIIGNASLKNAYLLSFCNLFSNNFSSSLLYPKIDSIANAIRSYVNEDQRKMFSNTQFETNIISDITVSGRRIPGLKSFISLRKSSVQSQLNSLGINCEQGINPNEITVPVYFELKQNYPNPFNPSTNIEYNLFKPGVVSLIIYDNNGKVVTKLVNNIYQNYGKYILDWNGKMTSELMFPPEFISAE